MEFGGSGVWKLDPGEVDEVRKAEARCRSKLVVKQQAIWADPS